MDDDEVCRVQCYEWNYIKAWQKYKGVRRESAGVRF
jgi:hypothetical protein